MIIKLCTTDGNMVVDTENIDFVMYDPTIPNPDTSMIHLKSGKTFEVYGTDKDLYRKMRYDRSDH